MKKYIPILLAVLAGLAGCQRPELQTETGAQELVFHAEQEDLTKTVLQSDGSVFWSPGDAIGIYVGEASSRFETSISAPAANADFKGSVEGFEEASGQVWAVYPYNAEDVFDGSNVTLNVPARQQAVAGSFDKTAFPSLARSKDFKLSFYHLCGGVKFSVNRSGITSVTFKGNNGETLAGRVKVGINTSSQPVVSQVVDGVKEIVLDAPAGGFKPNTWYYISALPATLSKGYTLEFGSGMGSRQNTASVTIRRAVWGVLEEADGIRVSSNAFSFKSAGGNSSLTVYAGGAWKATSEASWCTVAPSSGTGSGSVVLNVAENTAEEARSTKVVFELDDHSQRREVSVVQDGYLSFPETVDWNRPFHHKSLVMRFTADWCGYCPNMAKAVNLAMEQHPGKLEAVNVHGGSSAYEFAYVDNLANQYGISGYPTGIVDGRRVVENYPYATTAQNIGQYLAETESNYPVSCAIGILPSLSGRSLSVDVRLFVKDAASYKVTVLLLESGMVGYQADYYDGTHQDYHHDLVARMSLTNVLGDAFTTSSANVRKDFHYTASIPSAYKPENMSVLVYVQRAYGSLPVVGTNYGGYFVENAVSCPLDDVMTPALD